MFSKTELNLIQTLDREYNILIKNGHDIRLRSRVSGHDWIIITAYNDSRCEILHRHSEKDPFHYQRGRFSSLSDACDYIKGHDYWYAKKHRKQEKSNMSRN